MAARAPVSLFSAAIPRQGGVRHLNEQWPSYWVGLSADHGMIPIDCIRPVVWDDPDVEWRYVQNTLLFVDETRLRDHSRLDRLHHGLRGRVLPLVTRGCISRATPIRPRATARPQPTWPGSCLSEYK